MEHITRPVPTLEGQRIVVTGASDGIGFAIARGVAARGGSLVLPVRDRAKGERAAASIRTAFPGAEVEPADLDLASLRSVRAFADAMRADGRPVHGLVNNAGVLVMDPPLRRLTEDGHELHLQTNHLGHFALTAMLLPLLAAGHGRVVGQTSLAVWLRPSDPDAVRRSSDAGGFPAYASSKLAVALFVAEFRRRSVAGRWGVEAAAAHPGIARTNILTDVPGGIGGLTRLLRPLVQDPDAGARPALRALTEPVLGTDAVYAPSGMFQVRGSARAVRPPDGCSTPVRPPDSGGCPSSSPASRSRPRQRPRSGTDVAPSSGAASRAPTASASPGATASASDSTRSCPAAVTRASKPLPVSRVPDGDPGVVERHEVVRCEGVHRRPVRRVDALEPEVRDLAAPTIRTEAVVDDSRIRFSRDR